MSDWPTFTAGWTDDDFEAYIYGTPKPPMTEAEAVTEAIEEEDYGCRRQVCAKCGSDLIVFNVGNDLESCGWCGSLELTYIFVPCNDSTDDNLLPF